MWELTLVAKKTSEGENSYQYEHTISFSFETIESMTSFIDMAMNTTTNTVEVNIKYLGMKG